MVTNCVPIEFLRKLTIAGEKYYKIYPRELDYHNSPLHITAYFGMFECCKYIMKRTKLMNPGDEIEGRTPLHIAAKKGHFEIVEYITKFLENKNPSADYGETPLHLAAGEGHLEIVKYLTKFLEDKNPSK